MTTRMKIQVTRDSVCMADDFEHHGWVVLGEREWTSERIVREVSRSTRVGVFPDFRLPWIDGGKATWCICSRIPLAIVAQEWREPRMLVDPAPNLEDLDISRAVLRVHIAYLE